MVSHGWVCAGMSLSAEEIETIVATALDPRAFGPERKWWEEMWATMGSSPTLEYRQHLARQRARIAIAAIAGYQS